jgi:hypothetical protein
MGVTRRETDIEVGSMIFDIWLSTLLCKNSQKSIESYLKTMKRIDKEVGCCKSLANGDKIKTRCFSLSSDHADDLEKSDHSTEGKSDGTTDLGTSALVSGGAGSGLGSRGLAGSPSAYEEARVVPEGPTMTPLEPEAAGAPEGIMAPEGRMAPAIRAVGA